MNDHFLCIYPSLMMAEFLTARLLVCFAYNEFIISSAASFQFRLPTALLNFGHFSGLMLPWLYVISKMTAVL
jgi:hypothetical protein